MNVESISTASQLHTYLFGKWDMVCVVHIYIYRHFLSHIPSLPSPYFYLPLNFSGRPRKHLDGQKGGNLRRYHQVSGVLYRCHSTASSRSRECGTCHGGSHQTGEWSRMVEILLRHEVAFFSLLPKRLEYYLKKRLSMLEMV